MWPFGGDESIETPTARRIRPGDNYRHHRLSLAKERQKIATTGDGTAAGLSEQPKNLMTSSAPPAPEHNL